MNGTNSPSPYLAIDEAGRGPVIGPLAVGVVEWTSNLATVSNDLVVRDSKDMTCNQRERYRTVLDEEATCSVHLIPAFAIAQFDANIQQIQGGVMVSAIRQHAPQRVVADSVGGESIHKHIKESYNNCSFVFEEKADAHYRGVSAASVLAKTARDRAIERIKNQYGDVGSGYPADPQTQNWLKEWKSEHSHWPGIVRTNWKTVQDLC